MSDEQEPEGPRCPRCQGQMALIRIWPKSQRLPEYRSYQCVDCKQTETYEHKERAHPDMPLRRRVTFQTSRPQPPPIPQKRIKPGQSVSQTFHGAPL
jgi:hypothetical protein